MKKFLKSKFFISILVVLAVVASSFAVLANVMPQNVNITVDYGDVIQKDFYGIGQNAWQFDLSTESKTKMSMTEAHSDLNQKRLDTAKAPIIRVVVCPHYLTYHETEDDRGEAKWNSGDLNFENPYYKALVHQLKMYQQSGSEIYLHWGYAVIPEIEDWFVMKDAVAISTRDRGAPENLEAFGNNLAIFLKHLKEEENIDNIVALNFYNESFANEFNTLGDKRPYMVKMLDYVNKALVKEGLRDKYLLIGCNAGTAVGFDGDWGENISVDDYKPTGELFKYLWENCLDENKERYIDGLDAHSYGKIGHNHTYKGYNTTVTQLVQNTFEAGSNIWIGEFGPLSGTSGISGLSSQIDRDLDYTEAEKNELLDAIKTDGYDVSWASLANAIMNSGCQAGLSWYYYGGITTAPVTWSSNAGGYATVKEGDAPNMGLMWHSPSAGGGVDAVTASYPLIGMWQRYLPQHAKILKSTSSSDDVRVAVATSNDDAQISYFVETNNNGKTKKLSINLGNYSGKTFKKYVYKYPTTFTTSAQLTEDEKGALKYVNANALIPEGQTVTIDNGNLTDEIGDGHYVIIYSTIEEAQQVYFKDDGDVQVEIPEGNNNSVTLGEIGTYGLGDNTNVKYEVLTNYDAVAGTKTDVAKATVDQSGKITLNENAKQGDWISIKVSSTAEGAKADAYAISLVKVTAKKYTADSETLTAMKTLNAATMANAGVVVDENNISSSVFNKGNQTLVANVIKKAMDGEDITIVGFGGSITEGADYNLEPTDTTITHNFTDRKRYIELVGEWFTNMAEPYNATVNVVNAGIGATDTVFGIHRMNEDVLKHNPDLVILEWDMNDSNNNTAKQATYENMVRKFLQKGVAVVMLGMCGSNTDISSQLMHEPIATHYKVPYISYKDAFVNEDYFANLTNDTVHPNIVGHHLTALLLNSYFTDIYENIGSISTKKYELPTDTVNPDATLYSEGYMITLSDIADGKIEGITMTNAGSFVKETEVYTHGGREYYAYKAAYAESYQPMVLEINNVNTLFFMLMRSYGIADGKFKIEIDNVEITNTTFSSSNSNSHDNSQIEREFLWASARAYSSSTKNNIKLEIIPTNETEGEYVGIVGLFLTGDFGN